MKLLRHVCRVQKTKWVYYTIGTGPTLLIVPPFHSDINRLAPIVEYLGKFYHVIIPEFPGIATPIPLKGRVHTAKTYALFMNDFVRILKLRQYSMLSLSLGTIIAIRMMQMGAPMPQKFIIYGAPYDKSTIRPSPGQRFILAILRGIGGKKSRAVWFARAFICNRFLLTIIFGIRCIGYKKYRETVKHQVHLTALIHPRVWIEVIDDVLSLQLSAERISFPVDTVLIYNKHDNILDVPRAIAGMKRIFPNATVKILSHGLHAPLNPFTPSQVHAWAAQLLPLMGHGSTLHV